MRRRTFWLIATLYFCQGLPFGFFTQTLPVLMRQKGLSLETIGMSSLLALPWGLKFLWAPVVDRVGMAGIGRRRSWILPMQALSVIAMVVLAGLEPGGNLGTLYAFAFLTNLVAATQDVAADALCVEMLLDAELGHANGLRVAAYRTGMIVGGGAMLIAMPTLGWRNAMLSMAAMLAVCTAPVLALREEPAHAPAQGGGTSLIREFLARSGSWRWLGVLVAFKFGESMGNGMVRPLLVDAGMSLPDLGWLLGTGAFAAGLTGALIGGALTGRLGQLAALRLFGGLQAIAVASYLAPALGHTGIATLTAVCLLEHATSGMATAALFTAMMARCRPGTAATDYTVQASTVVLASGAAVAAGGALAGRFGYPLHFAVSALVAAAALVPVQRCADLVDQRREEARRDTCGLAGS